MPLCLLKDTVGLLKPSGSSNDAISPRFLMGVFPTVGPSVLMLINSSLVSGIVPRDFTHAVIQPLVKKNDLDPSVCSNYKPISKLPFLFKVLEKIVNIQFMAFLKEHSILVTFQFGC